MNVKLIRMWSGEDVIADQVGDLVDTIVIRNPIVAIPAGNGQMGFAPWSPLLKDKNVDLEITKNYIAWLKKNFPTCILNTLNNAKINCKNEKNKGTFKQNQ